MLKIEEAPEFGANVYHIKGWDGIAWRVLGWETQSDEDSEWSGVQPRTGKLVCVMVGDDRKFMEDPEYLTPLSREDYCGGCGQIGCGHGRE